MGIKGKIGLDEEFVQVPSGKAESVPQISSQDGTLESTVIYGFSEGPNINFVCVEKTFQKFLEDKKEVTFTWKDSLLYSYLEMVNGQGFWNGLGSAILGFFLSKEIRSGGSPFLLVKQANFYRQCCKVQALYHRHKAQPADAENFSKLTKAYESILSLAEGDTDQEVAIQHDLINEVLNAHTKGAIGTTILEKLTTDALTASGSFNKEGIVDVLPNLLAEIQSKYTLGYRAVLSEDEKSNIKQVPPQYAEVMNVLSNDGIASTTAACARAYMKQCEVAATGQELRSIKATSIDIDAATKRQIENYNHLILELVQHKDKQIPIGALPYKYQTGQFVEELNYLADIYSAYNDQILSETSDYQREKSKHQTKLTDLQSQKSAIDKKLAKTHTLTYGQIKELGLEEQFLDEPEFKKAALNVFEAEHDNVTFDPQIEKQRQIEALDREIYALQSEGDKEKRLQKQQQKEALEREYDLKELKKGTRLEIANAQINIRINELTKQIERLEKESVQCKEALSLNQSAIEMYTSNIELEKKLINQGINASLSANDQDTSFAFIGQALDKDTNQRKAAMLERAELLNKEKELHKELSEAKEALKPLAEEAPKHPLIAERHQALKSVTEALRQPVVLTHQAIGNIKGVVIRDLPQDLQKIVVSTCQLFVDKQKIEDEIQQTQEAMRSLYQQHSQVTRSRLEPFGITFDGEKVSGCQFTGFDDQYKAQLKQHLQSQTPVFENIVNVFSIITAPKKVVDETSRILLTQGYTPPTLPPQSVPRELDVTSGELIRHVMVDNCNWNDLEPTQMQDIRPLEEGFWPLVQ